MRCSIEGCASILKNRATYLNHLNKVHCAPQFRCGLNVDAKTRRDVPNWIPVPCSAAFTMRSKLRDHIKRKHLGQRGRAAITRDQQRAKNIPTATSNEQTWGDLGTAGANATTPANTTFDNFSHATNSTSAQFILADVFSPADHNRADQGPSSSDPMDHDSTDSSPVDSDLIEHHVSDPDSADFGMTDYRAADSEMMDHGAVDHSAANDNAADFNPAELASADMIPTTNQPTHRRIPSYPIDPQLRNLDTSNRTE